MHRKGFTLIELLLVVTLLIIVGSVVFQGCLGGCFSETEDASSPWSETITTITVNDKYVIANEYGNEYRIEATTPEGDEVFNITDSFFDGQYRSADFFAKLVRGRTFQVRCRGFRSGRWSAFRNIVEILNEVRGIDE